MFFCFAKRALCSVHALNSVHKKAAFRVCYFRRIVKENLQKLDQERVQNSNWFLECFDT